MKRKKYHQKLQNQILQKVNKKMTESLEQNMKETTEVQKRLTDLNNHLKTHHKSFPKQWNCYWKRHQENELLLRTKQEATKEQNLSKTKKVEVWTEYKNSVFLSSLWTLLSKGFIEVSWLLRDLLLLKNEELLNTLVNKSLQQEKKNSEDLEESQSKEEIMFSIYCYKTVDAAKMYINMIIDSIISKSLTNCLGKIYLYKKSSDSKRKYFYRYSSYQRDVC